MTECGDGVHDITKCQWGDWLLVKFGGNSAGRGSSRGGGSRGGATNRGRGRGRGSAQDDVEGDDMEIYERDNQYQPSARTEFIGWDY